MSYNPGDAKSIFLKALELPMPAERSAFVEQACAGQPELKGRVEVLLKTAHDPDSLLDQPISAIEATHVSPREPGSESLGFLDPCDVPGSLGQIGSYVVLEFIGRGGMGIVVRAMDAKLNRIVAIKVLAPEFAGNPQARKRFKREAQAAAAVSHDHVVTIHAVDDDQKLPFIVMECIVGQSLQQKIDKAGALNLKEILRIGMQAALGLSAAHAQGLVHRDIKPANILLENGVERVKLTDFGLARMVDDASVTQSGVIAGTPQYMSPEQARGDSIDLRSDLFSLGCVLYAMCVGHAPFRASTTMGVLKRVCEETPRPIHECNPEIPVWLTGIIDKLLAKSPNDRFQSAAEVAELLRQSLAHLQQPNQVPLPKGILATAATSARNRVVPQAVKAQLAGPARLLVATGILNWLTLLFSVPVMAYLYSNANGSADLGVLTLVYPILAIGSAVIIYGAIRMWNADSFGWAMVSSIAAMMIGPGYLLGWPAGVWSLAVLSRPDVRQAFPHHAKSGSGLSATIRWAAGCVAVALLAVGIASTFSPTFSLWVSNQAGMELETGDGESAVELLRDGRTVATATGVGRLAVSPGYFGLRVHGKPNQKLQDVQMERLSVWPWERQSVSLKSAPHTIHVRPGDRWRVRVTLEQFDDLVATVRSTSSLDQPEGEWTPLFNGQDLKGWKTYDNLPGNWSVKDNSIVSEGPYSFLLTDRDDFADFHLRAEVRINGKGDSGILVRCPYEQVVYPKSVGVKGYEAQIQSVTSSAMNTGALAVVHHDGNWKLVKPATEGLTPAEQWFTLEIIARGNRIVVGVNGQITADYTDADASLAKGHIALQQANANTVVQFRKIEVREYTPPLDLNGIWETSQPWPVEFTHRPITPGTKSVPIIGKYESKGMLSGGGRIEAILDVATRTIDGDFFSGPASGKVHLVVTPDGDHIDGKYGWREKDKGDDEITMLRWDMTRQKKGPLVLPGNPFDYWKAVGELAKNGQIKAESTEIVWGRPSPKGMQLGVRLKPAQKTYAVDDVIEAILILGNSSDKPLSFARPRLEVFEKYGFDLFATDDAGRKLNWNWGSLHKGQSELTVSGALETHLQPGKTLQLPIARIALAGTRAPDDAIAVVHVDPGQVCRLQFKLGTYGYAKGEGEPLESGPIEFQVSGESRATAPRPALLNTPFDSQQAAQYQKDWAEHLRLPVEQPNTVGMKLRLIPPGEFEFGSTPEQVEKLLKDYPALNDDTWTRELVRDEAPARRVSIRDAFYLSACEVTVEQFRKFVTDSKYQTVAEKSGGGLTWNVQQSKWEQKPENIWSNASNEQLPVGYLTLDDVRAFCQWLSTKEQRQYQVPTDEQWEYACRAGTSSLWYFGDDPSEMIKHGWTVPHAQGVLHAAGRLAPNPFGLMDLYGNASEIVVDNAGRAVERSGSPGQIAARCRSAFRWLIEKPNETVLGRGFRVALAVAESPVPKLLAINLNGDWTSHWGTVTFTHETPKAGQAAIPMKAAYYGGAGSIEGTLNLATRTFEGRFKESNGMNGPIRLSIDKDDDSIKGVYAYRQRNTETDPTNLNYGWDMTRKNESTVKIAPPIAAAPFDAAQASRFQQAWAQYMNTQVERTDSIGLALILVPPGTFRMGSTAEELEALKKELEGNGASDFDKFTALSSGPQHPVELTQPFYMSKYEVTVAQFQKFVEETNYKSTLESDGGRFTWKKFLGTGDPNRQPVCGVSWEDARAFCQWLGTKASQKKLSYDLPTEAQWEFACRAGTQTLWSSGDDVASLSEQAIFGQKGTPFPAALGLRRQNAFGLFDMHGNVDEWCLDWHSREFYTRSPLKDPVCDTTPGDPASGRVARGGAWNADAWWSRSTTRAYDFPTTPTFAKGFRVVRRVEVPAQ